MAVVRGVIAASARSGESVSVPRLDVGEDRFAPLPREARRRRHVGEGRRHDLALQLERAVRELERDGAVAHEQAMPDAEVLGEPPLQLDDERARVGELVARPDAAQQLDVLLEAAGASDA